MDSSNLIVPFGQYKGIKFDNIPINFKKFYADYTIKNNCSCLDDWLECICEYPTFEREIVNKSEDVADSILHNVELPDNVHKLQLALNYSKYLEKKLYDREVPCICLRLYFADFINEVRNYLKKNKICILCFNPCDKNEYHIECLLSETYDIDKLLIRNFNNNIIDAFGC